MLWVCIKPASSVPRPAAFGRHPAADPDHGPASQRPLRSDVCAGGVELNLGKSEMRSYRQQTVNQISAATHRLLSPDTWNIAGNESLISYDFSSLVLQTFQRWNFFVISTETSRPSTVCSFSSVKIFLRLICFRLFLIQCLVWEKNMD